jgi:hypothetical protein
MEQSSIQSRELVLVHHAPEAKSLSTVDATELVAIGEQENQGICSASISDMHGCLHAIREQNHLSAETLECHGPTGVPIGRIDWIVLELSIECVGR